MSSSPATAFMGSTGGGAPPGHRKVLFDIILPETRILQNTHGEAKDSSRPLALPTAQTEAEFVGAEDTAIPRLTDLIRDFNKPNRRMLLILDEAQVLAEPSHSDLAHSLRASLDGRKQNIKVVFAGSSEATLRRMFGRSTEPFYEATGKSRPSSELRNACGARAPERSDQCAQTVDERRAL